MVETILGSDYRNVSVEGDEALARGWYGRVFVHPPIRKIEKWVRKGLNEALGGRAEALLLLIPTRTDAVWWRPLLAFPVAFLNYHPEVLARSTTHKGGQSAGAWAPHGLVLVQRSWTADDLDRLTDAVGDLGAVYAPMRPPWWGVPDFGPELPFRAGCSGFSLPPHDLEISHPVPAHRPPGRTRSEDRGEAGQPLTRAEARPPPAVLRRGIDTICSNGAVGRSP